MTQKEKLDEMRAQKHAEEVLSCSRTTRLSGSWEYSSRLNLDSLKSPLGMAEAAMAAGVSCHGHFLIQLRTTIDLQGMEAIRGCIVDGRIKRAHDTGTIRVSGKRFATGKGYYNGHLAAANTCCEATRASPKPGRIPCILARSSNLAPVAVLALADI